MVPGGRQHPGPRIHPRTMDAIIVPSTKQKVWDKTPNTGPVQARYAYVGPAFTTWRAYAEDSGCPWFILSTKYGLIAPGLSINNYSVPISAAEADPAFIERLRTQIRELKLDLCREIQVLDLERFAGLIRQAMGSSMVEVQTYKILF
jgi:hypothetical protein